MKTNSYATTVSRMSDRKVITSILTHAISASRASLMIANRYPKGSVFVTSQPINARNVATLIR